MSEPHLQSEPVRFAALTLAIVTVRASAVRAAIAHDFLLTDECNRELRKLEAMRDSLAEQMERIGGA